jgi:hypothetical protein
MAPPNLSLLISELERLAGAVDECGRAVADGQLEREAELLELLDGLEQVTGDLRRALGPRAPGTRA